MKINKFFKLGKEVSIRMTGKQNFLESSFLMKNNIENIDVDDIDTSICSNCILHIENKTESIKALRCKEEYCLNYCQKRKNYIKNKKANNDNFFGIIDKRLSRLQLCQMLLYNALDIGPNGIIKNISEKEVASILNCTVKTVRNNNKRLAELNYIYFTKISSDRFNVLLLDYNKYHLPANEGGRGYIVMSSETLMKLLNIKNVNSLRIAIRNLVKFDDNNVKRTKTRKTSCTYDEISFFLPNYVNHKAIIDRMLDETSSIFDFTKTKEKVSFVLKEEYNGKNKRRKLSNKYKAYIKNYCEKRLFPLTDKDYDDLIQMSLEYRFSTVITALDVAYKKYYLANAEVKNYGGLVREIIKTEINKKQTA